MRFIQSVRPVLFMALILLAVTGCGKNKDELLTEGKNAVWNGDYHKAVIFFKNALAKDKNFTDAHFHLAEALTATGKNEEAELEYKKVLTLDPARDDAQRGLASLHIRTGKPDLALAEAGEILKRAPKDAKALELMGIASLSKNSPDTAESYLQQAMTADPNLQSVKLELAGLYRSRGNMAEARRLAHLLENDNNWNLRASCFLAEIELQEGKPAKALDIYMKASDKNKGAPYPLYQAGMLYLETGARGEAIHAADQLVERFPSRGEGHHLHGLILYREQKYADAISRFTKALQLQPSLETDYLLGLCHFNSRSYDLALSQFRKILAANPSFLQARLLTASILLQQKQADAAIAEAKTVLEAAPRHAMAHNILGSAYMQKGEFKEGMAELNRALELDPKIADTHIKKGLYSIGNEDYREAENELQTAVRLAPDLIDGRRLLASFYAARGDSRKALATLNAGLAGTAADAEIYTALAGIYTIQKQPDAAYDNLLKAKKANPAHIPAYFALANHHLGRNEHGQALAELQTALAQSPDNIQALMGVAELYELTGHAQEALDYYRKAAATKNEQAVLTLAAHVMRAKQPVKEALQAVDEVIAANPKSAGALLLKGDILLNQKEYQKALVVYSNLEQLQPDAAQQKKFATYLAMKDHARALEIARGIIGKNPKEPAGYLLAARAHESNNDIPRALEELQAGVSATSGNPALHVMQASLLEKKGDAQGTAAAYAAALAKDPDNAMARFHQGMQLYKSGDKAGTIAAMRAILAKHKGFMPAVNNLAFLLAEESDPASVQEGLNLAFSAFALTPESPSVIDTLGYALTKAGRADEAVTLLEKGVKLQPENKAIAEHLAEAKKLAVALPKTAAKPAATAAAPVSVPAPVVKSDFTPSKKGTASSSRTWLALIGILIFVAAIIALIAYRSYRKSVKLSQRKRFWPPGG